MGMFVHRTASSLPREIVGLSSKYLQQPRPSSGVGPVLLLKVSIDLQ